MTKKIKTTADGAQSEESVGRSVNIDQIQITPVGSGVSVYAEHGPGIVPPSPEDRVEVSVLSDIRDLKQGRTETVTIWGMQPDLDFVGAMLMEKGVRERVTDFFLRREINRIVEKLISTPFMRPEEAAFTKSEYFDGLVSAGLSNTVARVIMELTCGPLMKLGILSSQDQHSFQIFHPFRRVTTEVLAGVVNVQQVHGVLQKLDVGRIKPHDRQSRNTFVAELGDAFMPIGTKLMDAAELNSVINDIVAGVRATIMPTHITDAASDIVPAIWRNNIHVQQLATCLPFVRAALMKPSSARLALTNETRTLEEWVLIIVNYLRDDKRYKWVSKTDMLRNYTTRKVRDMKGSPKSIVAHRSIKAAPAAQSVLAIEDAVSGLLGAVHINATRDRLAAEVQAAYGSARFNTDDAAELYGDIASDLITMGYTGSSQAVFIDAVGDGSTLGDIAVLASDRVEVELDGDGQVVMSDEVSRELRATDGVVTELNWEPRWWYSVKTTELNFDVKYGFHYGDRVFTCSPVEALTATEELTAVEPYPDQPQLLGQNAFNTLLLGFEQSALMNLTSKFKFAIDFVGRKVSGAFKGNDFATLRSNRLATLVKPHFNEAVIRSVADVYGETLALIAEATSEDARLRAAWIPGSEPTERVFATLNKKVCTHLLEYVATQLSESFRNEVHAALIERAAVNSGLSGDELIVFRAQMHQRSFAAHADLIALQFFLFIQGISCPAWDAIMESETMANVCMLNGSKRKLKSNF